MRSIRSRSISRRAMALLFLIALLALALHVRRQMQRVPHTRVGPLTREVPLETESLRLAVIGDTGTGGEAQLQVAAAMERRCLEQGFDAILLLGDNFYQHGVQSVEDPQWQTKILEPYGSTCLSKLPIYPILGNHDYKGNPAAQIEYSLINDRWRMPNRFYAVRFGHLLHLVAYDSEISDVCFKSAFCSIDFMLDRVAYGEATWTIVMGHHPIAATSDKGWSYSGGLRGKLIAYLLCDKADAYLAGHVHQMEHRVLPGCRMQEFIMGGGGGDLYSGGQVDDTVKFLQSQHGFLELDLKPQSMQARFFDIKDQVLYETSKARADSQP